MNRKYGISMRAGIFVFILFTFLLLVIGLREKAYARVTGIACYKCHTMHNSQDGSSQRGGSGGIYTGLSAECRSCHDVLRTTLLKTDCIGCHAEDPENGPNIGSIANAPQVAHNGTDLAGGNFRYVFNGNDTKGHNVHGFYPLIGPDNVMVPSIPNRPPGYNSNFDYGGWQDLSDTQNPLMCAGSNGCHGDRSILDQKTSIAGAHHADDSILQFGSLNETGQGTTVGKSYRYLLGVHGGEDDDWESITGPGNHNEYKGAQFASRTSLAKGDVDTISELCSECHGAFHMSGYGGIGIGSSPWVRHPVDYAMPLTGEFSTYAYDLEAPVARVDIPDPADEDVSSSDKRIVMCLSCHRAHASPYEDSLRWQYDATMKDSNDSGGPTGCYRCHTSK